MNNFLSFTIIAHPFIYASVFLCLALLALLLLKYKIVDIKVLTRASIFICVYSFVLGVPLWMGYQYGQWVFATWLMAIFATAGPFLYIFVRRRAEARIFQDQRRYQKTLRQASYGMGRIKDLRRLLNLIAHVVIRTVGLEHSMVYIRNLKEKKYFLGAFRSRKIRFSIPQEISFDSPIVSELSQSSSPIVYRQVRQRVQAGEEGDLRELLSCMEELKAAVVVPSFVDLDLISFIVLGKKVSGKPYTEDDLAVFSILANQAALAIENAQFYEDIKKTHEQLIQAEKMATVGTMADGLSHQINNRLHALGFIASDILDTVKLMKGGPMPEKVKEFLIDMEHALSRIQSNVEQGGEIVRGLLKYTRRGESGFSAVDLDSLVNASIEMTQFKIKEGEMDVVRDYGPLPQVKGNFTQLQEVLFNVIDNAYDAMMQRKQEMKEPGYRPTLKISASVQDQSVVVIVEDNGIGVKDGDKEKLFTPFFTTKASTKKGTGLGLYVIQKIIEDNHQGSVSYDSTYMKGTTTKIVLPVI